jgi:hypothetical protein
MGFFKRRASDPDPAFQTATLYSGTEWLEVKGEASYQGVLESIAGPKNPEGYNFLVQAVLVREPDNPYDSSAIAVYAMSPRDATAVKVGHIPRDKAALLTPAIERKNAEGRHVALEGYIRGGWLRPGGDEGKYGIWLLYDPADFGLK